MDSDTVTNMYSITPTIGCVCTGLPADARALVMRARHEAAEFTYKYGYDCPIAQIAGRMSSLNQVRTQYAGSRPMGVGEWSGLSFSPFGCVFSSILSTLMILVGQRREMVISSSSFFFKKNS